MYAAELDPAGVVLRVIVGDVAWAETNLGGRWVACRDDSPVEPYPGIGWGYDAGALHRFAPVAPPGLERALVDDPDALPAESIWWDNGSITTIEEIAGRRGVLTPAEVAAKRSVRPERNI